MDMAGCPSARRPRRPPWGRPRPEAAAEINAAMEAGRPVDDELMIKVLRTAVDGAEPELGLLLDGFP